MDDADRIRYIRRAAEGDPVAISVWLEQFRGFIRVYAFKYGVDPDSPDLQGALMYRIHYAAERYDLTSEKHGQGATWPRFLSLVLRRVILDEVRKKKRERDHQDLEGAPETEDHRIDLEQTEPIGTGLLRAWQDYARNHIDDAEAQVYAALRRTPDQPCLFDEREGVMFDSGYYLANDGISALRIFARGEAWEAVRLNLGVSGDAVKLLKYHFAQAFGVDLE